jgi:protease-4
MKKRPFFLASLTIGLIFLFFLLVIFAAGILRGNSVVGPVGNKLGILEVRGIIVDSERLVEQIEDFRDSKSVKAVVLRIDSPGGGVGPSQEIHAELLRLAQEKPLIVSMGSVAASGGYYLAVAGERIFANPGTITGSIGVIMSFPDIQELMGKVGIKTEVVKSGRFKDIGSSSRSFTAADRELLQGMIDDVHAQFVEAVSVGRNIPPERLQPYVDGRILSGRQALEAGLVDELGTLARAINYAAKIAGLGDDPPLVYPEPEKQAFLERLLQGAVSHYLGVNIRPQISIGPQYLWDGF